MVVLSIHSPSRTGGLETGSEQLCFPALSGHHKRRLVVSGVMYIGSNRMAHSVRAQVALAAIVCSTVERIACRLWVLHYPNHERRGNGYEPLLSGFLYKESPASDTDGSRFLSPP